MNVETYKFKQFIFLTHNLEKKSKPGTHHMPMSTHAMYEMSRYGLLPRPTWYELSQICSLSQRVAQACWVRIVLPFGWIW